jgi:hypothetical protein
MKEKNDQMQKSFKPPFFRNNSQASHQGQETKNDQTNAYSFEKRQRQ